MLAGRRAAARAATSHSAILSKRMLVRAMATESVRYYDYEGNNHSSYGALFGLAGIVAAAATHTTVTELERRKPHYDQPATLVPRNTSTPTSIPKDAGINQPPSRPDLPTFTREEVAEHCDEDSLWYTFRGAVYDLTSFYQGHPGGAPVSFDKGEMNTYRCNML